VSQIRFALDLGNKPARLDMHLMVIGIRLSLVVHIVLWHWNPLFFGFIVHVYRIVGIHGWKKDAPDSLGPGEGHGNPMQPPAKSVSPPPIAPGIRFAVRSVVVTFAGLAHNAAIHRNAPPAPLPRRILVQLPLVIHCLFLLTPWAN
jgi:hypothetical protein